LSGDLAALERSLLEFRDRRDWKRFHTPRQLCASVAIEAAELLELTQWKTDDEFAAWAAANRALVAAECADVLSYLILLASTLEIDLGEAIRAKMAVNETRFPPRA
jgi:NTP pyrophosphatase (non-canonical NTP hydrolase)